MSSTVVEALVAARSIEPIMYDVRLVKADLRAFTLYAGDHAYEDHSLIDGHGPRHRLEITSKPWVYERTI